MGSTAEALDLARSIPKYNLETEYELISSEQLGSQCQKRE